MKNLIPLCLVLICMTALGEQPVPVPPNGNCHSDHECTKRHICEPLNKEGTIKKCLPLCRSDVDCMFGEECRRIRECEELHTCPKKCYQPKNMSPAPEAACLMREGQRTLTI